MFDTVTCPYCGEDVGIDLLEQQDIVTYWGEEHHEIWCDNCDEMFLVEETVCRSYQTKEGQGR